MTTPTQFDKYNLIPMIQFKIDDTLCVRCGECAADCPAGIIAMNDTPEITNEQGCFKCLHCYAVCPTGALSILGNNPDSEVSLADQLPHAEKVSNLIRWRRSVRRYKDENLKPELIDEILQAACHAPTGVNACEVLFTVVRDKAFLEKLSKELMERLSAVEAAGNLPEGLLGQYLALVVKVWKTEGRDIILKGALILPVLEGHSVKRVYSLTEVFDDNENKIKQDQAAAFTAVQDRITGPCRKGWCSDSGQAIRAS